MGGGGGGGEKNGMCHSLEHLKTIIIDLHVCTILGAKGVSMGEIRKQPIGN